MKGTRARAAKTIFRLGLGLSLGLTLAMAGCVGEVRDDGGGVVVAEPDYYLFGGYYDGGSYRDYGRRGYESRRSAGRSGGDRGSPSAGRPGGTAVVPAAAPSAAVHTTVVPSAGRSGERDRR
jgi:hypothetical protein